MTAEDRNSNILWRSFEEQSGRGGRGEDVVNRFITRYEKSAARGQACMVVVLLGLETEGGGLLRRGLGSFLTKGRHRKKTGCGTEATTLKVLEEKREDKKNWNWKRGSYKSLKG